MTVKTGRKRPFRFTVISFSRSFCPFSCSRSPPASAVRRSGSHGEPRGIVFRLCRTAGLRCPHRPAPGGPRDHLDHRDGYLHGRSAVGSVASASETCSITGIIPGEVSVLAVARNASSAQVASGTDSATLTAGTVEPVTVTLTRADRARATSPSPCSGPNRAERHGSAVRSKIR